MTVGFALTHAVRSLVRERQRTVLAAVCIAFGVLSLVSMQLLSATVQSSMSAPPRLALGGDARISPADHLWSAREDALLHDLEASGTISASVREAPSPGNLVRREGVGRVYFVMRTFGVDAATYPLAGEIVLTDPRTSARAVLERRGAVIITRDLARKLGAGVGDVLLLSGEPGAPPARLSVGAVARSLPDRRGDTMLFGLETADSVAAGAAVVRSALVALPNAADTMRLRAAGWDVETAASAAARGASTAELFGTMLTGAGLLGLLVGGVGVANTLQVVLARRRPEIAALKTLGYQQSHLLLLFALETGLLGLAGSIAGVCGAVVAGRGLTQLMSGMETALLLEFRVVPEIMAGGVAIGVVTALVFGLHAIVRTSAVRPAVLLRDLPVTLDGRGRALIAALHVVLLLTIFAISAVVLGSAVRGLLLTLIAVAGLVLLGALLSAALHVFLRLPMRGIAALSRRNLGRHPVRSAFALIALFAGVFSIAMAATVLVNGRDRVLARTLDVSGQDILVHGARSDSLRVIGTLRRFGAVRTYLDVRAAYGHGDIEPVVLRGVPDVAHVTLLPGGHWTGADDEAVVPISAGDSAEVVAFVAGDRTLSLRVVGRYKPQAMGGMSRAPVLVPMQTARLLAGDARGAAVWSLAVPADRMDDVADAVSAALPGVTVVSPSDFRDFMNRVYRGLFRFVAGVSALALAAGVVLIANAVGLSLVERRRDLGVLKALGYGRSHIMAVIALENGMLGCVGGLAGIGAVYATIAGVNAVRPRAELALAAGHAGALVLLVITLAVATAFAVAWGTTGLRPLSVLREE